MTFPAFVFAVFLAALFGSLLHLWRGGPLWRLVLYLVLSEVGFFVGHALGEILLINFINLGPIHLGFGILGSLALLGLGYWLSLVDFQNS